MPLIPKSKPVDTSKLKHEFIELGWKILYHKCLYYELAGNSRCDYLRISDSAFDSLEGRYLHLAKILKERPTAHEQVGFSLAKGSGHMVLGKVLLDEYLHSKQRKPLALIPKHK